MRSLLVLVMGLPVVGLADWQFTEPVVVSGKGVEGVFPHLEAAGRQSMAITGDGVVALVWEDNRSGQPGIYLATKAPRTEHFTSPQAVNRTGSAYEPAVTTVDGGFVVAWEQDGKVLARRMDSEVGPIATLSEAGAQVTLATDEKGDVHAAWSEQEGGVGRITVAGLLFTAEGPALREKRPADAETPRGSQLYPTLAPVPGGPLLAWEDRRHGHTRLYTARPEEGGAFTEPKGLNELPPAGSARFGRGSGVTRVALASEGKLLAATWMDKREFRGGYDIYAAVSRDGGQNFGPNELTQDLFGENQPQWHPDVAVSARGRIVTAWDDPRDGTPDLWLSWRTGEGEWSSDITFEGGSGPGAQTHPVIEFEGERLHLAWLHRPEKGPVEIRYSTAEWVE
ncbi:hypothetical protein [Thiohalomonas denitrificans]|uniref:BNR repeat-like domain-containing protein n=1 Tax=Thiohalomonas denitrificans TaxID=415747 RepID=A0A1G5PS42_9GAMM|nr:hypothetical protein [Thiohalomonas denitrificans]SCZ52010.1 hypothetical protein SAMN03097708_00646 [Thiohalomonas denitrificans]